jgi:glutamine amidotransferase-like uncharacterized protein/N-formylglutamate amidohydrolase
MAMNSICRSLRRCAGALLFLWAGAAQADETTKLVYAQSGELPIILSAPHGGKLEIPDVPPRVGTGLKRQPGGFVVTRDTNTEELALQVAAAIEARFGKKPYLVVARSHRRFMDPNREPAAAYEHPAAKRVYDEYHETLTRYCRDVQKKYRQGLLLDLHGQSASKETVYRGTKHGLTVTLLRERFGEQAHSGADSLFGRLKSLGWKVHPDPHDGKEQSGFTGGFIVQTYGSHQGFGIDAIQLEFGGGVRFLSGPRGKTASVLTTAVADYAVRYLDWKLPPVTEAPAAASTGEKSLDVAVYRGTGASASRDVLIKALRSRPGLNVRDVSADEIRDGKLQGARVLIHPGGSGSGQGKALGEEGRRIVRDFVKEGGGYVGVCAGAYLATCDYDWSLHILDAKVVDRQHWNRGFGTVEVSLSPQGRQLLAVNRDRVSIYYHQGPLLAPAENPDIPDYDALARFETEIVKNGAPAGVMHGTTAMTQSVFHKGRVFCFSPHPERTDGLEPILIRAIRWAAHDE